MQYSWRTATGPGWTGLVSSFPAVSPFTCRKRCWAFGDGWDVPAPFAHSPRTACVSAHAPPTTANSAAEDSGTCLNASGRVGGDDGEERRSGEERQRIATANPRRDQCRGRAGWHEHGRPQYSRQARFVLSRERHETGLCLCEKARDPSFGRRGALRHPICYGSRRSGAAMASARRNAA